MNSPILQTNANNDKSKWVSASSLLSGSPLVFASVARGLVAPNAEEKSLQDEKTADDLERVRKAVTDKTEHVSNQEIKENFEAVYKASGLKTVPESVITNFENKYSAESIENGNFFETGKSTAASQMKINLARAFLEDGGKELSEEGKQKLASIEGENYKIVNTAKAEAKKRGSFVGDPDQARDNLLEALDNAGKQVHDDSREISDQEQGLDSPRIPPKPVRKDIGAPPVVPARPKSASGTEIGTGIWDKKVGAGLVENKEIIGGHRREVGGEPADSLSKIEAHSSKDAHQAKEQGMTEQEKDAPDQKHAAASKTAQERLQDNKKELGG